LNILTATILQYSEGDTQIDLDSISYQDIRISFYAVSVPSYLGESDIDICLEFKDGEWVIVGKFGQVYSVSPYVKRILDAEEVVGHLDNFFMTELPLNPRKAMGFDGTTYTLEISRNKKKNEYEWWTYLPREWERIGDLVGKLYEWVGYSCRIDVLEEEF